MNLIHKHISFFDRIAPISKVAFMLPKDTQILKVAMGEDQIRFWTLDRFIDSINEPDFEVRHNYIIGNNQIVNDRLHYLDTIFDGDYVWHIFEEKQ